MNTPFKKRYDFEIEAATKQVQEYLLKYNSGGNIKHLFEPLKTIENRLLQSDYFPLELFHRNEEYTENQLNVFENLFKDFTFERFFEAINLFETKSQLNREIKLISKKIGIHSLSMFENGETNEYNLKESDDLINRKIDLINEIVTNETYKIIKQIYLVSLNEKNQFEYINNEFLKLKFILNDIDGGYLLHKSICDLHYFKQIKLSDIDGLGLYNELETFRKIKFDKNCVTNYWFKRFSIESVNNNKPIIIPKLIFIILDKVKNYLCNVQVIPSDFELANQTDSLETFIFLEKNFEFESQLFQNNIINQIDNFDSKKEISDYLINQLKVLAVEFNKLNSNYFTFQPHLDSQERIELFLKEGHALNGDLAMFNGSASDALLLEGKIVFLSNKICNYNSLIVSQTSEMLVGYKEIFYLLQSNLFNSRTGIEMYNKMNFQNELLKLPTEFKNILQTVILEEILKNNIVCMDQLLSKNNLSSSKINSFINKTIRKLNIEKISIKDLYRDHVFMVENFLIGHKKNQNDFKESSTTVNSEFEFNNKDLELINKILSNFNLIENQKYIGKKFQIRTIFDFLRDTHRITNQSLNVYAKAFAKQYNIELKDMPDKNENNIAMEFEKKLKKYLENNKM